MRRAGALYGAGLVLLDCLTLLACNILVALPEAANALYDAALKAGCEIVERHGHSRIVPGSAAVTGRDATIAWNYVDLRFKSAQTLMLRVQLERDALAARASLNR